MGNLTDGRRHLNGRPKRVSKLPTIDDDDFVLSKFNFSSY